MCLIAIWVTRRHLVFAFRTAFSEKSAADADEPMRYRTALFGLVGGFLFMFIFSYQAGMSVLAIPVFFGLYFAIAIAVTRLRAEFGAPHGNFQPSCGHDGDRLRDADLGGGGSLTVMSFYQWFNRSYRSHAMPNQFEPLKMAEVTRINTRRLIIAMMVGAACGTHRWNVDKPRHDVPRRCVGPGYHSSRVGLQTPLGPD